MLQCPSSWDNFAIHHTPYATIGPFTEAICAKSTYAEPKYASDKVAKATYAEAKYAEAKFAQAEYAEAKLC